MQNLLAAALQHHKGGQIAEAERCYRRALKAQPRNAAAHHMLGILLAQTGRAAPAVESISRAVDIEP